MHVEVAVPDALQKVQAARTSIYSEHAVSAIPGKSRRSVLARAGSQCERCGLSSALELHHRLYRSRGGSHDVANLVALCSITVVDGQVTSIGGGGHSGCHGAAHGGRHAEESGWSIRTGGDPLMIPVRDSQGFWWLLRADGLKTCIPAQLADEYRLLAGLLPVVID